MIGILAFLAAAGAGGETTGTHGALQVLLRQPLGRWLLGLLAAGLFGYSMWRIIAAVADPEGRGRRDWKRIFVRIGYAGSAIVHAALGWEAARLALGQGASAGDIDKRLALGSLGPDERRLVVRAARIGMVARGVVFVIIGLFLATASLQNDPREAGGLGEALGMLREQPYAPFLLGGVALGLAAYGAFQLARARYRVIATP